MTSELLSGPRDRMYIQHTDNVGRTTVLCSWKDGEWKTEVFASEAHALDFADQHHMEVNDARRTG